LGDAEDVVALDNGQGAKVAFKEVDNMWFKSYGVRRIIGIALVACLAAGASVISFTNTSTNRSQAPVPVFPRNANGQTYGSGNDIRPGLVTPGSVPDLIKAQRVDGTVGYVRFTDLQGLQPKNPQEAVALDKYNLAHPTREIPLYAVDGKTVIGLKKFLMVKPLLDRDGKEFNDGKQIAIEIKTNLVSAVTVPEYNSRMDS
jgi:hypothetical protein